MYDMTRVSGNDYNDAFDNEQWRHRNRENLSKQRLTDPNAMAGGVLDTVPPQAPNFVHDYYDYYKTPRGYHKHSGNSNDGWCVIGTHTDRTAYIVKQLMALLATGISRTERDVSYYAERLNVSPKYLSATIKRVTGHSVTSYIDRHTIPILKDYLNDERLSLTQIAELMNFTTLSYFSRYCTKHLGQSPSDYRLSLQPK